jgi:predicted Rossmann-fold nucleotide-binding protein
MAEFVNGYEAMGHWSVRFYFGSARTARRPVLLTCRKIAYKISKAGYRLLPAAALALWKRVTKEHLGGGTSGD